MRRKHSAIEGEILRTAAVIFGERGYQATTLDDIAVAARISRGTFYSYFPSKEELLRRMYREVISSTQAALEKIAQEDLPVSEKLRRIIRFLVSYLATHKPLMQVFFSELLSLPSAMSRSVTQANRDFCGVIEGVIEEGIRTGVFHALHPKRFTYMLLGACNWMHRWYRPGGEWTPDLIADEIIRVVESGCLKQQPETSEAILLREVRALREEVRQIRTSGRLQQEHDQRGAQRETKPGKRGERNRAANSAKASAT